MTLNRIITSLFLMYAAVGVGAPASASSSASAPASASSPAAVDLSRQPAAAAKPSVWSVAGISQVILSNPELLEKVNRLAEQKVVQDVLDDRKVRQAMAQNHYHKLLINSKFREMMTNDAVTGLVREIIHQAWSSSEPAENKD